MANNKISRILSESMVKEVSSLAGGFFPGSGKLIEKGLNLAAGRTDVSQSVTQSQTAENLSPAGSGQDGKKAYRKSNYNQDATYNQKNDRNSARVRMTECDICGETKDCNKNTGRKQETLGKGAYAQVELLRQGIILSEVLGQPVCKTRHRRHA